MIEEQFVSFETARLLKEAGFDEVCRSAYYATGNIAVMYERNSMLSPGYVSRPTQVLAARWLREVHRLFIEIFYRITGFNYEIIYTKTDEVAFTTHEPKINFISYEGCLEDALQEAIKLIKK